MILLDTHIWVWWANQSSQLTSVHGDVIRANVSEGLGVSAISCWEIAKFTEKGRLQLSIPLDEWLTRGLALPGMVLVPLTPDIVSESVKLEPPLDGDPADQIIVATSRVLQAPLVTADQRLIQYAGVITL